MRSQKNDFKNQSNSKDPFYDIIEDYELIVASFAQQYGIRLRQNSNMPWGEFITLLAGLNNFTPLGKIVSIRSENDPKKIKEFSADERKIRNAWRRKKVVKTDDKDYKATLKGIEMAFIAMAKAGDKNG